MADPDRPAPPGRTGRSAEEPVGPADQGDRGRSPVRRFVTVLFADLAGYTALCAALDPEDVEELIRPAMRLLVEVVRDHGGTVLQILGDGVYATFGGPATAHEDDPNRAVAAAIAMTRGLAAAGAGRRAPLELHVGMASGEVLVTAGGDGPRLIGEAVNLAARLCAAADAGEILIGPTTRELTAGDFRFGPERSVALKGLLGPQRTWPVLAATGSQERERNRDPATLVGRADEHADLERAFETVTRRGSAGGAEVVGEAGIGKTALVETWVRGLVARRPDIVVLHGTAPSAGATAPLAALADAILSRFGLRLPTTAQALGEALDAWQATAAEPDRLSPAERAAVVALVVGAAGKDVADAGLGACESLLRRWAAGGPVVVVLDDLRDPDGDVRLAVRRWATRPLPVPVLVVATGRRRETLLEPVTRFALAPLPRGAAADLVRAHLGSGIPVWTLRALLDRAAGNPLFLIECCRTLLATGTVRTADDGSVHVDPQALRNVPTSLRGMLEARLDALPPDHAAVLRDASVTGDVTWTSWIATRHPEPGRALAALEAGGLVGRRATSSVPDTQEWAFTASLVRDVAYAGLARRDRAQRHAAAAGWMLATERRYPAWQAPLPALANQRDLAWRMGRRRDAAGRRGPGEPDLARAAVGDLRAWGDLVAGGQPRIAEQVYARALEVCEESGAVGAAVRAPLLIGRSRVRADLGHLDDAFGDASAAAALADDALGGAPSLRDDLRAQALAVAGLARCLRSDREALAEARGLLAAARELAEAAGDRVWVARTALWSSWTRRYTDLDAVVTGMREAYDLFADAGARGEQLRLAEELGLLATLVSPADVDVWLAAARDLADGDDPRAAAARQRTRAFALLYSGEPAAALRRVEAAREKAELAGSSWLRDDLAVHRLACLAQLGRSDEVEQGMARLRTADVTQRQLASAQLSAARAAARAGRIAVARRHLTAAVTVFTDLESSADMLDARAAEAEVLLAEGGYEAAAEAAEQVAAESTGRGWRLFAVGCLALRALARLGAVPVEVLPGEAGEALAAEGRALADTAKGIGAGGYEHLGRELTRLGTVVGGGPDLAPDGLPTLPESTAVAAEAAAWSAAGRGDPEAVSAATTALVATWGEVGGSAWLARAWRVRATMLERLDRPVEAAVARQREDEVRAALS